MSSIDALGKSPIEAAQTSGFSAMSSEDFTKIIFTELSKQDPLQPNDSSQLLQQISMIRSIQGDIDLTDKMKGIASQNEFANAAGLIGKHISGIADTGQRVNDTVLAVSRTTDGPILSLANGHRVPMSDVDQIVDDAVTERSGS
jgi:flagellar basal-body rod modification protein FlgD